MPILYEELEGASVRALRDRARNTCPVLRGRVGVPPAQSQENLQRKAAGWNRRVLEALRGRRHMGGETFYQRKAGRLVSLAVDSHLGLWLCAAAATGFALVAYNPVLTLLTQSNSVTGFALQLKPALRWLSPPQNKLSTTVRASASRDHVTLLQNVVFAVYSISDTGNESLPATVCRIFDLGRQKLALPATECPSARYSAPQASGLHDKAGSRADQGHVWAGCSPVNGDIRAWLSPDKRDVQASLKPDKDDVRAWLCINKGDVRAYQYADKDDVRAWYEPTKIVWIKGNDVGCKYDKDLLYSASTHAELIQSTCVKRMCFPHALAFAPGVSAGIEA
ncbi:hypothetical protein DFH09DRAFT_1081080 [Mycena vulgaris]|nr:hypothetical protein DFH09DRAFT_1081080 [Mycena vulgaris]